MVSVNTHRFEDTSKPLPKFAAIYTVRPAPKMLFRCDYTVNQPDESLRIIANDITMESDNKKPYPVGVRLEIRVDGGNPDEAFQKADKWAAAFVSTLSFVSNRGVGDPQSEFAFEISDSSKGRSFLRFIRDPVAPSPSGGAVDAQAFTDILGKLVEENLKYGDRVGRAISFYNRGLREIHPLERFMSFWLGFETLNQPLKEVLSAPDTTKKCRKCGLETKTPSLTGVKELMRRELADGEATFRKMRDLRVKVFHSTEPLGPLLGAMATDADVLQELLRKTVFMFLGVPYEGEVVRQPVVNLVPVWYGVEGVVTGFAPPDNEPFAREYPHLVVASGSLETLVEDDGSVTRRPTYTYASADPGDGALFSVTGSRIYGERGKIKNAGTLGIKASDSSLNKAP